MDVPFLNMAVAGETALAPRELLTAVKDIEQALGAFNRGHWSPREIDIDILAFHDLSVAEPVLAIPHTELLKRDFALIPFAELAPDWIHPLAGISARELAGRMDSALTRTDIVIA